jgi:hypothetical protein
MRQFTDAAGRTAWVDANGMVFTENGTRATNYNVADWNTRQLQRWGAPSSGGSSGGSSSGSIPSVSAWFGSNTEAYRAYKKGKEAGKWKDIHDYISKGGTKTGMAQSAADYAQSIIDTQQQQIDKEKAYIEDYLAENPFAFDELLAKQSATAEYEPYYTELLNDYIEDIDLKRATVEDDARLSEYLSERSAEKTSREYEQAIASAEEGFAGSGMFFSGIKDRTGGLLGIEKTGELADISTKQDYTQRGYNRQLGSLQTQEERQRRDIGREQQTAIAGGIEQRRGEALKGYWSPIIQGYQRQFPTSGNVLGGYLPEDYLMF